jgi:hypothetical protein
MLATFGTIFKGEGIYADSLDKLRVKPSQKPGQEEDSGRES